ncbi:MAG: diguanylate cyclase [Chloroflexota bacterium]
MIWNLRAEIFRRFVKPVILISWSLVGGSLLLSFILPLQSGERIRLLGLFVIACLYFYLLYSVFIPRFGLRPWMHYAILAVDILFISLAYSVLGKYQISLTPVYVLAILFSGMLAGKRAGWLAAGLSFLGSFAVENVYDLPMQQQTLMQGVHLLAFSLTAYVGSALGEALTNQVRDSKQRNDDLSLLLEASLVATSSLDLEHTIPLLAQKIVQGLPVSFARIDLLNGDEIVPYGQAGFRFTSDLKQTKSLPFKIAEIPWFERCLTQRRTIQASISEIHHPEHILAFYALFPEEVIHVCFVPLVVAQRVVGIISVGEARQSEREAFTQHKLDFLETLANQISVVIENASLNQAERKKARRLEILHEISSIIGSTIELNDLLEKLYSLLIQVLPADTYYVGILNPLERVIELRLFIDEGERFSGQQIPVDSGLAGYVVREQKPLLVYQLSQEMERLPVKPLILGKAKVSESWLGVPMSAGEHFRGVLAIASYQPNMFTEEDLSLLMNVASQAALALDNARHHAEVEERARRDSLTGAYNHGHFLLLLKQLVGKAMLMGEPLSLIMLDIDYFKEYNDQYGHLVGDDVLCLAVDTIQKYIKSEDIIGRWGGEEFGVILNQSSIEAACRIANQIRRGLAEIKIDSDNGSAIPTPTVSQGIASLPAHTDNALDLVEKADQALYTAKSAGRDKIRVFGEVVRC